MKCQDCEYDKDCFSMLKTAVRFGHVCKQGRAKRTIKAKVKVDAPTGTDNKVA